jgi:hypothetical protein
MDERLRFVARLLDGEKMAGAIGSKVLVELVGRAGGEPATNGLKVADSVDSAAPSVSEQDRSRQGIRS